MLPNKIITVEGGVKMLEIRGENLQYIYQDNENKGAIMDIHTFEAVMGGVGRLRRHHGF